MLDFIKKGAYIGAGLAVMTTEKIQEVVSDLVKTGGISEQEGKKAVADLVAKSRQARLDLEANIESKMTNFLQRWNVPTRAEFNSLEARLEALRQSMEKPPKG